MHKNTQSVTIKSNKPLIVISVEEYENMKETLYLLAQYPGLLEELKNEQKKVRSGKYTALSDYKAKYKKC
jgi:PHD/YefM family antitoxin component YafN of YafNO toxin-antitoxin module